MDTNPPVDFKEEEKLHLVPMPFQIRTMSISSLYAGKMHAVLCRGWQSRPKGRDWYDLVWYVKNGYELDMTHLECKNRSKPDNDARVRPDAKTEFNRTVKRCSTGH